MNKEEKKKQIQQMQQNWLRERNNEKLRKSVVASLSANESHRGEENTSSPQDIPQNYNQSKKEKLPLVNTDRVIDSIANRLEQELREKLRIEVKREWQMEQMKEENTNKSLDKYVP